ncbi:MAG: ABC transporter permease subunit [Kiritimatiellia bacterium]
MERLEYFVRRLLLVVPTFIGITALVFALIQFVPGGPVEQMLARMRRFRGGETSVEGARASLVLSEEYRKQLEKHFGFDLPLHRRYLRWLVRDRLGLRMQSYKFPNKTVWQLIRERFPVSLVFGLTGFVLTYAICIPLGIAKALRHGSAFDVVTSAAVFIGYAIPPLALGMVLRMLFSGTVEGLWDIFPLGGLESDNFATLSLAGKIVDRFRHMFLPVLCYVIGDFAILTILMKNSLLEQIGKDYVRAVIARGGSVRRAVWGHAFRNSLIPIATGFGRVLSLFFAGSVIIEQIFEIPGMGRLTIEAAISRDYAVFMGILSLASLLALLGNVLSDFCYVLIDPRIHFGK